MDQAEFDKFASEYEALHAANIRISGESPEYFAEYKVRDVAASIAEAPSRPVRILDFGAGVGGSVPHFRRHIPDASLTCLDVSPKSLEIGRRRFGKLAMFVHFDGTLIPFPEGSYDVTFAACVFHHIDAAEHIRLLQEWHRVLAPGGRAFVFEHNPLNPLTVRAVDSCAFDENAVLIGHRDMCRRMEAAGFRDIQCRFRIFFPRALKWLRPLETLMAWCPLGAQYYVAARK